MSSPPRRSLGGTVVEDSLRAVGFAVPGDGCALVETARPGRYGFTAVLAQNAWNVIPRADFDRLAAPYPSRMVARMRLRRLVAQVNLRRTRRVVCLSEAMADLVRGAGVPDDRVVVAPAYLAVDMTGSGASEPEPEPEPATEPFVLVPGTLTWYKDPQQALSIAVEGGYGRVRFTGPDDGSGCWQDVERRARGAGLRVSRETLGRDAMKQALRDSALVVIPSRLESLGFSLGEALTHAGQVMASALPAHLEAAAWIGSSPTWLAQQDGSAAPTTTTDVPGEADVRDSWVAVGEALGLRR